MAGNKRTVRLIQSPIRVGPIRFVAVFILIVAFVYGLVWLDKYVKTLPLFTSSSLTVELYERPAWLSKKLAGDILRNSLIDLKDTIKVLHKEGKHTEIAKIIASRISSNGWVDRFIWIRRTFGSHYIVNCSFREPICYVEEDGRIYLISKEGYILPGSYTRDSLDNVIDSGPLLAIKGYAGLIPRSGSRWLNPDIQAGLQLADIIRKMPFKDQVKAIDVSNYNGRINPATSWIVLITDRDTIIHWGRPMGKEDAIEIPAANKLSLLMGIYKRFGHIDFGRAFVDIRRSPFEVDVSVVSAKEVSKVKHE